MGHAVNTTKRERLQRTSKGEAKPANGGEWPGKAEPKKHYKKSFVLNNDKDGAAAIAVVDAVAMDCVTAKKACSQEAYRLVGMKTLRQETLGKIDMTTITAGAMAAKSSQWRRRPRRRRLQWPRWLASMFMKPASGCGLEGASHGCKGRRRDDDGFEKYVVSPRMEIERKMEIEKY